MASYIIVLLLFRCFIASLLKLLKCVSDYKMFQMHMSLRCFLSMID